MLTHTTRWSHPPGNAVVPSGWQATRPARTAALDLALKHALAHPAWGHRKIWAMVRHGGHVVSEATILRLLRDDGLILPAAYQKERRKLAERRKAAFAVDPTGPNQVWRLDFSEFETTTGGTWRLAGARDCYSKYEHRFHVCDGEPVRRDRRDRAGPGRVRGTARASAARSLRGRPGDRRDQAGGHDRHRQRRPVPVLPVRSVHPQAPRVRTRADQGPHSVAERGHANGTFSP